jgi:ankyrin repeat protein
MWSGPFKMLRYLLVSLFLATWALSSALSHQAPGKVDFRRDVQPLFKQFCIECHGPSQQMHGFRLDRRRDAMRGGAIVVITPGNSGSSRLYHKLMGNKYGPQMPPAGPLTDEQVSVIKAWIDQGAEWPDDLSGDTPPSPPDLKATRILAALRDGDKQAFETLASKEPKVGNLKGPGGTTPLMQAALYGDVESVRFLLANGADPNIRNEAGATALMWAVDDFEKTRLLLERGADVNARSDDGRTPLLIAAGMLGNKAVVKFLLDRGANLSAKSPTTIGYSTPLSEAARGGDNELLRVLIERGADVKGAGFQPLANANRVECAECLETLMERTDRGTLTIAATVLSPPLGDARAVETLLKRGADPNAREPKGHTILMLAASSDAIPVETVKSLIERGADLNAKSPEGKTALDFAKLRGPNAVADLLVKAGAKEGAPLTKAGAPTATASLSNAVLNPKPAGSIRAALERSIPLLQKTDVVFMQKAGCVSCHHNNLTAMTVATALKNGLSVDKQIARDQRKKVVAYIENWRERALQGVGIPGEAGTSSYILMGLAAENYPPDAATDALARYLESQQWADGRWRIFGHRPPISSGDIQVTAASLRSLQVYGLKAQRAKYERAVKRAAGWLATAQPQTTQERSFQLLGLGWAGLKADKEIIRKAAGDLLREQRADGGWAQLPSLASDAYATGQALVALKQAGALSVTDAAYKRGIEYLLKTQFEDGSWYVKSRAIPIQPFFESGFPHGQDQWISAAASNWAAMALALTVAPQKE